MMLSLVLSLEQEEEEKSDGWRSGGTGEGTGLLLCLWNVSDQSANCLPQRCCLKMTLVARILRIDQNREMDGYVLVL
jgi:hypothetical protein